MTPNDPLSKLLPFSWRGTDFPCTGFSVDLTQEHAEHKFPDRDGAHIEATGRNPLVYTAKAFFVNGVQAGVSEKFGSVVLYPDLYRLFLSKCADRTTGTLVHPELGSVRAKCRSAKTIWDPNRRNGVEVDVIWIEDTKEAAGGLNFLGYTEASVTTIGSGLDDAVLVFTRGWLDMSAQGVAKFEALQAALPPVSFAQMMNSVLGLVQSVSRFQARIASKINEVFYRLDVLSEAVDRMLDPQTNPIRDAIERNREVLHNLRNTLGKNLPQPIAHWTTTRDMTLAQVSAMTGAPVAQLLAMNTYDPSVQRSGLKAGPLVPAGTTVRYYANDFDMT